MRRLSSRIVLACVVAVGAAPIWPTPGPAPAPAAPGSTVLWGNARFTVLSPTLLRLELAGRTGAFDDRPSIAVVGRATATPPFSIETRNSTLFLRTAAINLTYTSPIGNTTQQGSNSTCTLAAPVDVDDGQRTPKYPGGANATSQADCCSMCDGDMDCTAWIFAPVRGHDYPPANCWLMSGVTAVHPAGNRVTGAVLPFTAADLNATFLVAGAPTTWTAGAADAANLGGAFHALDCYDSPDNCTADYAAGERPGLLSRSGWALLDDTAAARLVPPAPGVPSPVPFWYANASAATAPAADWYLFAAGLDYRTALADYASIGGTPALAPASVYGVWWSHWQKFSQAEFVGDILGGYANHSLPLDHVMLDVDWHTEDAGNASVPCYDYGGYTVNRTLWPDWPAFVAALHAGEEGPLNPTGRPQRLMLNLHPQGGTDACQANWPAFAAAIDYAGTGIVPCTFGVQRIAAAAFSAFMDADVLADVDGWWTDFDYSGDCFDAPTGGAGASAFPGMAWSNEVFAGHQVQRGRRPLVLSRSGGLGAHRNPVSFSGDTHQHRDILRWQLRATPAAANVLHSWSHDIGGFFCSINQTECSGDPTLPSNGILYLRWLQAGATWPVLRTHASEWGLAVMERRVWAFPPAVAPAMMDALRLRSALGPYLYSEARAAHDTGVATVHPMYYDAPEADAAYSANEQHAFGSALVASPLWATNETVPAPDGGAALGGFKDTWLPAGGDGWSDWNGTQLYAGGAAPATVSGFYKLNDTPLFARAGAVVPLTAPGGSAHAPDPLVLVAFPAPAGTAVAAAYALYEDDGASLAATTEGAAYTFTPLNCTTVTAAAAGASSVTLTVGPAAGAGFAGALASRRVEAHLRGFAARAQGRPPAAVSVNGVPAAPGAGAGCAAPCWWIVAEAQHTLAAPAGTLVVEAGAWRTDAAGAVVVTW